MSESTKIRLRLVGKPQCLNVADGRWHALSAQAAALLALLAIDGAAPRAAVAAMLWPDAEQPRVNLRDLLRKTKALAGSELCSGGDSLQVCPDLGDDLAALDPQVTLADPREVPHGELLGAFEYPELDAYAEWLGNARERWRIARRRALDELAGRLESERRFELAVAVAERLIADDPTDESGHRWAMRLWYRRGDRSAALAAYARCGTAARRGAAAEPSQATRALATLIELGQPLDAESPRGSGGRGVAPLRIVGREAELAAIEAAWAQGFRVLFEGESGVGKSVVLGELARRRSAVAVAVLHGDAEVPFALLTRLLRALRAAQRPRLDEATNAELARLAPEFGRPAAHVAQHGEMVGAFKSALRAWSRAGVTAIVVDDAHWADVASLQLLLPALDAAADLRWLFARRRDDGPAGLDGALSAQAASWNLITLRPFDPAGIERLLRALPLAVTAPAAWAAALARHTGGNAFCVVATVQALRDAHGERCLSSAPPAAGELPVPATAERLIEARIGRLAEPALHLAQLAALAGALFSAPLAMRVMRLNELQLGSLWATLQAEQVLADATLVHDSLRGPLLAGLPLSVARELHARVAEHGEQAQSSPAEVGRHWMRAQRWEQAATAYEHAAMAAGKLNAPTDAMRLWDLSAECLDHLDRQTQAYAARCAASAAALTCAPLAEATERAARLLTQAETDEQRLSARLLQARLGFIGHDLALLRAAGAAAVELADDLAAAGRIAADDLRRLDASASHALGQAFAGEIEAALREIDRWRRLVTACPEVGNAIAFHEADGTILNLAGRPGAGIDAFERALELARSADDVALIQRQLVNLATASARQGRYRRSLELVRESVAIAERLGEVHGAMAGIAHMNVAGFGWRVGHYAQALDGLRTAHDLLRDSEAQAWVADCESHLCGVLTELGDFAGAAAVLQTPPAAGADHRLLRQLYRLRLRDACGEAIAADAAELVDAHPEGRLENRLFAQLLHARVQPADDAVASCRRVLGHAGLVGSDAEPSAVGQHASVALAAALLRAGRPAEAAAIARGLAATLGSCQPLSMTPAEAWWVAARAFAAAGCTAEATRALAAGRSWLVEQALPHVPAEMRAGFLQRNAVNRELLAAAERAGLG